MRELIHVVERAAVLCGGEVIDVADLPESVQKPSSAAISDAEEPSSNLHEAVARLERRMIVNALRDSQGNRSEAARRLGIARAQLYAKIEEYGI
ncbi:MAG: helix-turn-helix domain-containing protein [Polyangiaceae bacterium]